MSPPLDRSRQPAGPQAISREETWSVLCISCDVTVDAGSREDLVATLHGDHRECLTSERVNVDYAVTTETSRQYHGSRPHRMWLQLPATLLHPTRSLTPIPVDVVAVQPAVGVRAVQGDVA